jgi:tetratricopeptide (TPR) repeat protein
MRVYDKLRRRRRIAATAAITIIGLLGAAGVFGWPHVRGWHHWQQAQTASAVYEFDEAVGHLQCCLAVWPRGAATHFQIGRMYRRQGRLVEARRHLQEANLLRYSRDELSLEFHLLAAEICAAKTLERKLFVDFLASEHDDDLLVYEAMVKGFRRNKFFDDAYRWASKWVQRFPNDWYAHYNRGLVLEQGENYYLASEDYRRALALKPDHIEVRLRLAGILLQHANSSHHPEALEQFQTCLRLRPQCTGAAIGIGLCQNALGNTDIARATLTQALSTHHDSPCPQFLSGLLVLATLQSEQNNPELALPYLQRAAALAPANEVVYSQLARALRSLGREEEAKQAEKRYEQLAQAHRRVEKAILELHNSGPAPDPAALARAVQLRYEAGMAMLDVGQEEEGVAWLDSARQIDPEHEPTKAALKKYFQTRTAQVLATKR